MSLGYIPQVTPLWIVRSADPGPHFGTGDVLISAFTPCPLAAYEQEHGIQLRRVIGWEISLVATPVVVPAFGEYQWNLAWDRYHDTLENASYDAQTRFYAMTWDS